MTRTDIINYFVKKYEFKSYLEIGVQNLNNNFNKIEIETKIGVDPDPNVGATFTMTSNDFFNINKIKFDIIFLDGLHHAWQLYDDVINSLKILNKDGIIVCHDMNPLTLNSQIVPRETNARIWNGDCWMAWIWLRKLKNLEMTVLDTDHGCGVIRIRNEKPLDINHNITYQNFEIHKKEWMNLQDKEHLYKM